MVGKISNILLSETSDNDRRIALEGLIISSDQEGREFIEIIVVEIVNTKVNI